MASGGRHVWAATHTGHVRTSNEDRAATPSRRSQGDDDFWDEHAHGARLWAAVADGMGGHEGGNVASDVAIDAARSALPHARTEQDMSELAIVANRLIFEAMFTGEGRMRMGSTLVAASIESNLALIVNVGDSRAYLLSDGKLRLLTKDDTLPSITPGRRQHMLTQSLGGLAFQAPITPHVSRVDFDAADWIILCSDGLTDVVGDSEISQALLGGPPDPAVALRDAALRKGARDNVTVIVIGPSQ